MTFSMRFNQLIPFLLSAGLLAPVSLKAHDPNSRTFLNGVNVGKVSFLCNAYYAKSRTLLSKYINDEMLERIMKDAFNSYVNAFELTKSEKNKQIKDILHFTGDKCQFMKELYEF